MTMHAAKGLEADVVFVYGGFDPGPNDRVRSTSSTASGCAWRAGRGGTRSPSWSSAIATARTSASTTSR